MTKQQQQKRLVTFFTNFLFCRQLDSTLQTFEIFSPAYLSISCATNWNSWKCSSDITCITIYSRYYIFILTLCFCFFLLCVLVCNFAIWLDVWQSKLSLFTFSLCYCCCCCCLGNFMFLFEEILWITKTSISWVGSRQCLSCSTVSYMPKEQVYAKICGAARASAEKYLNF